MLKMLPDESVHCVVTSPPYFGLRDYGMDAQIGLEAMPDVFVDELAGVFREARRVLRADGVAWVNMGDSYNNSDKWGGGGANTGKHSLDANGKVPSWSGVRRRWRGMDECKPKDLIGIPWMLAFAMRADGWYLRQDIIWHKPNPMPESVTDRCTKAHEYLFLLAKSERYYFDQSAITEAATVGDNFRNVREPVDSHMPGAPANVGIRKSGNKERKPAGARGMPNCDPTDPGDGVAGSVPWEGSTRNKRSVWTVTTQPFKEAHFATFPPALIEPCILAGCPEGGTVLDPFGGAGTTGLVADRHGRNAILIELNPEYAEMAKRRIQGDSPLFAEVA